MSNKEKYRKLCVDDSTIPLFSQAWWLDAVSEDEWDVVLVEKDGMINASLPFVIRKRLWFNFISQPHFTPSLGPWLRMPSERSSKRLAVEKDLLQALFCQLPKHHIYRQSWHYSRTNWLPLYWMGYNQTTRYTYVIDDLSDLDNVFSEFEHSKRKNIKKAEQIVRIEYNISSMEFYENHKKTLAMQNKNISYSYALFKRIYDATYLNNSGFTIAAYDKQNNMHAALFIVRDSFSAYDLISTIDPNYRHIGAASLLIKNSIKEVSKYVNAFDFEGSMIESVERSFRQFGAKQKPYFYIDKFNSRFLKAVNAFRSI